MKNARDLALGFVIFSALCCILALPRVVLLALPRPVQAAVALGVVVWFFAWVGVRRKRDAQALDRIAAWVTDGGWTAVPTNRSWPWTSLLRDPGSVVVKRAWQSIIDDLLITVGEVEWADNALDGAVVGWAGKGVFVEIQLPVGTEPMGIRRPHRTIGASHRLDRPELHDAYENGEIPPFTARDRFLFTFEAVKRDDRMVPELFDRLIERTRRIVRLLDLGPDAESAR